MRNKIFRYYGGKYYMIDDILRIVEPLIKDKKVMAFVDVFGGSGTVLLNIPIEYKINRVYNDIDKVLYRTIKAMIDDNERNALLEKLNYAVQSRELFNEIKNKPYNEWTAFEYLYMIACSFNANLNSYAIKVNAYKNSDLNIIPKNILNYYHLLKNWNVENLDFRKLIPKYDSPNLKGGKSYKYSFNIDDIIDLKKILDNIQGYYLLNESSVDFEEIEKVFGKPTFVKEYINHITNPKKGEKRSKRRMVY